MKLLAAILVPLSLNVLPLWAHAASTTDYPEVVAVYSLVSFDGKSESAGRCTGTFIHPRLVLTAAHCVTHFNAMKMNGRITRFTDMSNKYVPDLIAEPSQVYIPEARWWGDKEIHPIRVYVSDMAVPVNHPDISLDYVEQDLAILEFASDTSYTRVVDDRTPQLGQSVVMMGYGRHGAPVGDKHYGKNKLSMIELEMLVSEGSASTCHDSDAYTNDWAVCGGDSGGPLMDAETGKLMGVASASVTFTDKKDPKAGKRKLSVYTNVTSGPGARFIRDVLAEVQTHKAVPRPQGRSGD